eukprot:8477-Heterococcus_DN1.PRE.2
MAVIVLKLVAAVVVAVMRHSREHCATEQLPMVMSNVHAPPSFCICALAYVDELLRCTKVCSLHYGTVLFSTRTLYYELPRIMRHITNAATPHGCQYLHINTDQSSAAVLDRNVPSPPDKPSAHTESDSSSTLAIPEADDSLPPYGFKCTVYPILDLASIARLLPQSYSKLTAAYRIGDSRHDAALARYLNMHATRKQLTAAALVAASWQTLAPSEDDLIRQPALKELVQLAPASEAAASSLERALLDKYSDTAGAAAAAAASDKRGGILSTPAVPPHVARCALLLALNKQLHEALPYLDLSQADRCAGLL